MSETKKQQYYISEDSFDEYMDRCDMFMRISMHMMRDNLASVPYDRELIALLCDLFGTSMHMVKTLKEIFDSNPTLPEKYMCDGEQVITIGTCLKAIKILKADLAERNITIYIH